MTKKARDKPTPPETKRPKTPKKRPFIVLPVHSCLSAFCCAAALVTSGVVSLYWENVRQDRTVTVEQILARRRDLAERIKNDPHIPPQAKAIALNQLQGQAGEAGEPPFPNRPPVDPEIEAHFRR